MKLPTPLKLAIVMSGIPQKDIAARVGMDPANLSRIVNGLWCSDDAKQRIAGALGRDVAELWPGQGASSNHASAVDNTPRFEAAA